MQHREIQRAVEDGRTSAISAAVQLKKLLEDITDSYDVVRELAYEELMRQHGGHEAYVDGAKVGRAAARAVYDFKGITAWENLKLKLKEVEDRAKHAAKVILERGEQVIDEDTGEIIQPCKVSYTKESIQITLPKA